MSGTTMSTPSSSDSGNISPASMTKMSSPQRTAMQFIPNSPNPPKGTTCNLPDGIGSNSMLAHGLTRSFSQAFTQAYETIRVDPARYLLQLQAAHRLPISNFQGVYSVDIALIEDIAEQTIRSGMRIAAVEGAGFGLGGIFTVLPDLSILAAVTL